MLARIAKTYKGYKPLSLEAIVIDMAVDIIHNTVNEARWRHKHNRLARDLYAAIIGKRLYASLKDSNFMREIAMSDNHAAIKLIRKRVEKEIRDLKM